jgi:hypothetical protein
MAASVALTYETKLTVIETLGVNVPDVDVANARIVHNAFNTNLSLNGTSSPPVTKVVATQKALAAGVGTLDLTALVGTNGAVVDLSTLKVQAVKFRNPSTNANAITVTFGAANPYLLGGAAWKFILEPGMEIVVYGNDKTPDVDSTHKNIDLAGTLVQALDVVIVAG